MSEDKMQTYQPEGAPVTTDVEVDLDQAEVLTEQAANEIMGLADKVELGGTHLKNLAKLGLHVKGVGVVRVQRGRVIVTQQRADLVIKGVAEMAVRASSGQPIGPKNKPGSVKDVCELAQALGYLMSKLTESQKFLLEMEDLKAAGKVDDAQQLRATFAAGEQLQPNRTAIVTKEVHIHQAAPSA